mgnify:CR=1 FL=1
MITNRLKELMDIVVGEEQSGFVPGRLITDNTLIAYECLHTTRKQRVMKHFFALKIDMMKAYDRVEWPFLEEMMTKLGFTNQWISMIM